MLSNEQVTRARKIRAEIQTAAPFISANADDATLLATFTLYDKWKPDTAYNEKVVLRHEELLYKVEQAHTSQSHQPPGSEGMLAIYRPVQGEAEPGTVLPWVSGEAVEVGDKRVYEGVTYECYAPVGANIWPPPEFVAAWKVAEV